MMHTIIAGMPRETICRRIDGSMRIVRQAVSNEARPLA